MFEKKKNPQIKSSSKIIFKITHLSHQLWFWSFENKFYNYQLRRYSSE